MVMPERLLKMKSVDLKILSALVDLIAEHRGVNIEIYKPRLSRTVEIRIRGDGKAVEGAYADLAKFASRVGWRIE